MDFKTSNTYFEGEKQLIEQVEKSDEPKKYCLYHDSQMWTNKSCTKSLLKTQIWFFSNGKISGSCFVSFMLYMLMKNSGGINS